MEMGENLENTGKNPINEQDEFEKLLGDGANKQEVFDRFLTYRRRMARLAAVQALYLGDMKSKVAFLKAQTDDLFHDNEESKIPTALELCQDVVIFYRSVFFTEQEYGWAKKSRKIDEQFMYELVKTELENQKEIDKFIGANLNKNWTVYKLDVVLRAIIRCAVAELLMGYKIEKAVLSSEYTNIASNFFSGKEVGFINGIVDKLYDVVTQAYPFVSKTSI